MSVRIARLRELFKEEISTILQREMKDPRIGFVSVLDVELSQDLRHARVFVSILGDAEAKAKTMAGLANAHGFIRKELGRRIRLRHMPAVSFRLDESIERGVRIQRLLRQVAETEGEGSGDASGRSDRGSPSKSA
ncbi:MAG TPA: 30S ribosome-binding factor RbfA [bacterium]|nr:30S ribosome-binding factor RbfA [bacterium]